MFWFGGVPTRYQTNFVGITPRTPDFISEPFMCRSATIFVGFRRGAFGQYVRERLGRVVHVYGYAGDRASRLLG
jgi:hypothetical protein